MELDDYFKHFFVDSHDSGIVDCSLVLRTYAWLASDPVVRLAAITPSLAESTGFESIESALTASELASLAK